MYIFVAILLNIMIAFMTIIGITLRSSNLPNYYFSIPYTAMGGVLLIGSARFYREFITISHREVRPKRLE